MTQVSLKQFHYDMALKQKAITYAAECGNRAARCKFTASEAMIYHWRNDCASRFSYKATTVVSQSRVDAAVLHFIKETHAKGCPSHCRLWK
jgi:hypothetical protein